MAEFKTPVEARGILGVETAIEAQAARDALRSEIGAIATGLEPAGNWDASSGAFPSGSTKGSYYIVSVAGTVGGQAFAVGDWLVPLKSNASTTTYAGNWFRADYSKVIPRHYSTVPAFKASQETARGAGSIWEAAGFQYEEVTSGEHLTNSAATPVKFKVLPGPNGKRNLAALGLVSSATLDQTAIFQKAAEIGGAWEMEAVLCQSNQINIGTGAAPASKEDFSIVALKGATIEHRGGTSLMFNISAASTAAADVIKRCRFQGIKFLGRVATDLFAEWNHLMVVQGVEDFELRDCEFVGYQGDGIYFGAGALSDLHNEKIRVIDCLFDGVNKDNRQAISVIDGVNGRIQGCTFARSTRSNMPGFIDFEPNADTSIIRDWIIDDCSFEDTDCDIGAISIVVVNHKQLATPRDITVSNCRFDIDTRAFSVRLSHIYDEGNNFSFIGNRGKIGMTGDVYPKVNGLTWASNVLQVTGIGNFGFDPGTDIRNLNIVGNTFDGQNLVDRSFNVRGTLKGCSITGNIFTNFTTYGVLLGYDATHPVSDTTVSGNTFTNIGIYSIGWRVGGALDGLTCTCLGNTSEVPHEFPAWRTDDLGKAVEPFNSANLPSAFTRAGVFQAFINGDTGVPDTGGRQGILTTHCEAEYHGRKHKYQIFWPSNNTVKTQSYFIRKAANATDAWEAWAEVAAV